MPAPGAGFGYAVFGTDVFGAEAETAEFTTKLDADYNEPILRLVIDGRIYDDYVIDAPSIHRGADIIAGTVNVVVSNTPLSRLDGTTIAFVDSDPDTITDSNSGFVTAGFQEGDRITVSGATEAGNNSRFYVALVAAGTLTLIPTDSVAVEAAGALISITSQPAFNHFGEDRIANMGVPCRIGLRFSGTTGELYLLTGTLEDVSYEGATCTLSIRDKMAPMLEKRIGSGQDPADYYSHTSTLFLNPAELVWRILVDWGGLDSAFNTNNVDIDWTSWDAWRTRCVAHNYQIRARFPGTTVQNALLRIGDMTNSFFWVDGEGKFQFTMFEPPYVADPGSDETYDVDNSIALNRVIDRSTVKNVIKIYYGHDPDTLYNPASTISSNKIGFGNDDPDRIYLDEFNTNTGFLAAGFNTDDPITVTGSDTGAFGENNDGKYSLQTVTDGVLTLTASNGLTDELDGASVTLTQSQDTSTLRSTSLVFNDTGGNDTITDVTGVFVANGITADDSVTISGSTSNDGTYAVDSVTANTITLDVAETLTQEPSGNIVILTQIHSVAFTGTTIGFDDDEQPGPGATDPTKVDHIYKADVGNVAGADTFIDLGFKPQYDVTVSGSASNDGTYELASVEIDKLNLLHQTLEDQNSGPSVTITQAHNTETTGKQFEGFIIVSDAESIALPGGIKSLTDDKKDVWHDNIQSAYAAGIATLLIYKFPRDIMHIQADMVGFLSEPGDEIIVTETYKNIDTLTVFIKSTDIDIEQGLVDITAERGG